MPFDDNSFNPDDEEQSQKPAQSNSTAPTGGVIPSGAPGGTSAAPNQNAPTSSGSFTNLQAYLDANRGNNLGSQLAGDVQNQVDSANSAQQSANQGFQTQVDNASTKWNPDLVNSATADPLNFSSDPNKVSQFQQQLNASYNGPTSIANNPDLYMPAYEATQNALQQANLGQSEGGRYTLLDQYFGNPSYSHGQKNLDQFLVQSDPTAASSFQNVYQGANQANQNLNNSVASDAAYAQNAAQQTAATAGQTKTALNNAENGIQGDIAHQLSNLQNSYKNSNLDVSHALGTGDFSGMSPAQLQAMGLQPGKASQSWNLDLNNYYTPASVNLNTNSVATADQAARLNALSSLGGGSQLLDPTAAGKYSDPNQLLGTFNQNQFQTDAGAKAQAWDSLLNNPNFFANGGNNAAGVANPQTHGSLMGELTNDVPGQQFYSNPTTTAQDYQQLVNYLNQQAQTYGANNYLNTGAQVPGPVNPLLEPWRKGTSL